MDRNTSFYAQVQLLLRVLPFVAQEPCFALKGGTAINLFVRDFPRLSVDIAVEEELEVEYISSVERYGIKKGVAQGIEQGIEQGRREAEEKLHNSIRQLIVQGILNDAQIAEVFDVPVADIAQLRLETKH